MGNYIPLFYMDEIIYACHNPVDNLVFQLQYKLYQ